jgi:hypothetical protein
MSRIPSERQGLRRYVFDNKCGTIVKGRLSLTKPANRSLLPLQVIC